MLKLDFINETTAGIGKKVFGDLVKKFEKVLGDRVDGYLGKKVGYVDLVLVGDEKIALMNEEYRGKKGPTDVIAFAYLEVTEYERERGDIIVGDIFISVDTAKRQAKENGLSLRGELSVLFVHGLLHCFGFDHKTNKQEKEMEGWATKVL